MLRFLTFLLAVSLLSSARLKASHISGAEITYEYIGDTSGVPFEYMVYLDIYRRGNSPVSLSQTQSIEVSSSCFFTFSFDAVRYTESGDSVLPDNGVYVAGYSDCVDASGTGFLTVSKHKYKKRVTLPLGCGDIKFTWEDFGRNGAITNLHKAWTADIMVQARLNTFYGPNSAVRFLNKGAAAFCLGQQVEWNQGAIEDDGDSVFFKLAAPVDVRTGNAVPFDTGFSKLQPITTTSGVHLDSNLGTLSFTPAAVEFDIVKIRAVEYRFDSTNWVMVGISEREMPVVIVGSCDTNSFPDIAIGGADTNSATAITTSITASCGTDSVYFQTSAPVRCDTFANTLNFSLLQGDSTTISLSSVNPIACQNNLSNQFFIKLSQPLVENDTLQLMASLSGLTNSCGLSISDTVAVEVFVNDCGVSIPEWNDLQLKMYPIPAQGILNIELPAGQHEAVLELLDMSGRVLYRKENLQRREEFDIDRLKPGHYLIRYRSAQGVFTRKFIKS